VIANFSPGWTDCTGIGCPQRLKATERRIVLSSSSELSKCCETLPPNEFAKSCRPSGGHDVHRSLKDAVLIEVSLKEGKKGDKKGRVVSEQGIVRILCSDNNSVISMNLKYKNAILFL
jgi:hypothetical protein